MQLNPNTMFGKAQMFSVRTFIANKYPVKNLSLGAKEIKCDATRKCVTGEKSSFALLTMLYQTIMKVKADG